MPSSWSSSLRLELQFTGEQINLWGARLNVDLQHLDYAIAGWLNKPITGDYILTTANEGDDEARAAMIKFTSSTLATTTLITLPSVSKSYFVYNATNKPLTFTTGAGATITVDAGDKTAIYCDGSAVHTITFGNLGLKDYIAAVTASAGAVPSPIGNAGKYLYTDGASVFWRQPSTTDLSDYQAKVLGLQVALSIALGSP